MYTALREERREEKRTSKIEVKEIDPEKERRMAEENQ
jgi:hypothetical protein